MHKHWFLILYFVVLSMLLGVFLFLGRRSIVELLSQIYFVSLLVYVLNLFYEKSK